ncbi:hypothetical protein ACFQL0_08640 [Haloplanus litoreus]|uniref:hypothetical protein n=1 Tax=Haloplanus litoreus TaxID=767515 RepID=UPI00361C1D10
MEWTRRALLVGAAVGFSGCLSAGDSNVEYPETTTATAADEPLVEAEGTEPAVDEEPTPQQTEPAVPNRELATEVERVYGGIEWFATDYDESIATYQRVLGNAMATVRRVRNDAEFDANSLDLVRRSTDRAVATAASELGDHFGIPDQMRGEVDSHVATIRRFGNRGTSTASTRNSNASTRTSAASGATCSSGASSRTDRSTPTSTATSTTTRSIRRTKTTMTTKRRPGFSKSTTRPSTPGTPTAAHDTSSAIRSATTRTTTRTRGRRCSHASELTSTR